MLQVGDCVGGYEIRRLLGCGGMGEVYEAFEPALGRCVALKILPADKSDDQQRRARFLHEARTASALNDPHIVTIFDIFTVDDTDVLVMELVRGRTLRDILNDGPMPLVKALDVAIQVAEGVGAAHTAGIVHRDVKPANVIVTNRAQVKILDFGVALGGGPTLTREGTRIGTLAYMSPEQTRGDSVDHRTDLWSAGVVLYEALTGVLPFEADSLGELFDVICERSPHPPSAYRPGLSGAIDDAVLKALAKRPPERYQSAAEMGAALTDALIGIAPVDLTSTLKEGGPRFPDPLGDTPRLP